MIESEVVFAFVTKSRRGTCVIRVLKLPGGEPLEFHGCYA
jgi:hypothetical protein